MAKEETKRYELGARFSRVEKGKVRQYKAGEVVELTASEAARFAPGRLKETRRQASEGEVAPPSPPPNPTSLSALPAKDKG